IADPVELSKVEKRENDREPNSPTPRPGLHHPVANGKDRKGQYKNEVRLPQKIGGERKNRDQHRPFEDGPKPSHHRRGNRRKPKARPAKREKIDRAGGKPVPPELKGLRQCDHEARGPPEI